MPSGYEQSSHPDFRKISLYAESGGNLKKKKDETMKPQTPVSVQRNEKPQNQLGILESSGGW